MLERLRELSRNAGDAGSDAGSQDRAREILTRLQELSHHPEAADASPEPDLASAPQRASPARPISPEDIMRRMRELSGAQPAADPHPIGGTKTDGSHAPAAPGADDFGGLSAFVPSPDMAITPAVDRAVRTATETAR